MIERMWINQPSNLQPDYKLHGTNVLVDMLSKTLHVASNQYYVTIYFVEGLVISQRIAMLSLSKGWNYSCVQGG